MLSRLYSSFKSSSISEGPPSTFVSFSWTLVMSSNQRKWNATKELVNISCVPILYVLGIDIAYFLEELKGFCEQEHAVLIHPLAEESKKILQKTDENTYELVDTENMVGARSRALNHRTYLGMVRKSVEMLHAGLKQDRILSQLVAYQHLTRIGKDLCKLAG